MKDRLPTNLLANGALRYGVYDDSGELLRYEYIKPEDEPTEEGTALNKATLLQDETEALIWGSPADRTVDAALRTITKGIHQVGDILVTGRTDLGDDWILCNGDIISDGYPILKEQIYPTRYGWRAGDRETTANSVHAYYGGKYWRVSMTVAGDDEDTAVIELYSADNLWDGWTLEKQYTDTTTHTAATSPDKCIVFTDGIFYGYFHPWNGSNSTVYVITVPLDNISAAVVEKKTGDLVVSDTYNPATGKWYATGSGLVSGDERYYIYESSTFVVDTSLATRYLLPSEYDYSSSYVHGWRPLYCKNGIVYGSFYDRHGSYFMAFTDPASPAIQGNNGTINEAIADAYFSDILNAVVGFVSNISTSSTGSTGAYVYVYDKETNVWTVQGGPRPHKIYDIFELDGLYYVNTSNGVTIYEDIRDADTIISIDAGTTPDGTHSAPLVAVPLPLRGSPVMMTISSGDTRWDTRYDYFTPHVRTVTVENAYVYIRGRVTE